MASRIMCSRVAQVSRGKFFAEIFNFKYISNLPFSVALQPASTEFVSSFKYATGASQRSTIEKAKESMASAYESAKEKAEHLASFYVFQLLIIEDFQKEKAEDMAHNAKTAILGEDTKDRASHKAHELKGQAQAKGEDLKKSAEGAWEKAKEKGKDLKDAAYEKKGEVS
jgi:hypothetical protein